MIMDTDLRRRKIRNKVPMTFVDAGTAITEYDKWKTLYGQLFSARGR